MSLAGSCGFSKRSWHHDGSPSGVTQEEFSGEVGSHHSSVDPSEPRSAGRQPPEEISLLQLVNVLLRHRCLVVLAPVAVAFLVIGFGLLGPRSYTATASFTPESGEGQAGSLSGLASQFGISVPTGEAGQSPQFYADLLESRELLREAVLTEYDVETEPDRAEGDRLQGDLVALLDIEANTRRLAVANAIRSLRDIVSVTTSPETGVVELSVTTRWPDLSRQVADRLIKLVNQFNLETRKTQAAAEREFIEDQVARAESALHAAEDSLEAFLERNRRYQNSPELTFRYERLQRQVNLRQQVFTSLSESHEQAKINEVRNTPVITVVEPPELPARPDRRRLALKGVLGLMLGGMAGVFWAFGREMMATSRKADPDEYAEFARLKEEAKGEVRGLWRRVRGRMGRS